MSVANGYGSVVMNGSVFMYDTGDTINSYKGEPTTNIAYATNNNLNSGGNWWVNGGSNVFSDNDTSISKPNISNINTSNLYIFSSLVTGGGSNQQLGTSIIPISPSTTYSFSIWYYFTGTVMVIYPYIRTATNNDSIGTFSYNGNTDGTTWPKNQWILLKATGTTQANETGIYMSSYTGNAVGDKVYYFGYQVEQNSHCTPLVLGTRSATEGLLPIVGNSTIDLTNMSYNSNAQMIFDGTDDRIDISYNSAVSNALSRSWEVVVKPTAALTYAGIFGNKIGYGCSYHCNGGIYLWDGNWVFDWYDNSAYQFLYSGVSPAVNAYTHIVGTYDASDQKPRIYINGELKATYGSATNMNYGGATYIIDIGWNSGGYHYFQGELPVTKYYSGKALSASEVQQNYQKYKTRFNLS